MRARLVLGLLALGWLLAWPGLASCDPSGPRLALVLPGEGPRAEALKRGALAEAALLQAGLDVIDLEDAPDADRAAQVVDRLAAQGAAAILVVPPDAAQTASLAASLLRARAQGVKVLTVDVPLEPDTASKTGARLPHAGPDRRALARQTAAYVAFKLGPRGRAFVLGRALGVRERRELVQALRDAGVAVAADEGVPGSGQEAAAELTAGLLQAKGAPNAVVCAGDEVALGVLSALDRAGLAGRVLVTGQGNTPAARREMRAGRLHATAELHPERLGAAAVRLAFSSLAGEPLPEHRELPAELLTWESFGKRLFFSVSELSNPFFSSLAAAVRSQADLHGMSLGLADAQGDDTAQLAALRKAADERVDALVVNAVDSLTVGPGLDYAARRGIPVVSVDRGVAGAPVTMHVSSDNEAGGRLAAEFLLRATGGRASCLLLEGRPGLSATHERTTGFCMALAGHPDFKVVAHVPAGFERIQARELVAELLRKALYFNAVFAHNDAMALGAVDAFKQAKLKSPPLVVGFDGTAEALAALQAGDLAADVVQQADRMAVAVADGAAGIFRGMRPPARVVLPVNLVSWTRP